jgi:hypothetical protein
MLLMTSNTRSAGVGQGRAPFSAPGSGRSEAQSLDGCWSGGYFATDACPCVFNTFTHSNRRVYLEQPPKARLSP